ncbi:MAG: malate synthase A [Oligoflexia bacterium]|nr:malate synthase A [Oligoflexia bacterium]
MSSAPVVIRADQSGRRADVLTPAALDFVAELVRSFGPRRAELLAARREQQARFNRPADDGGSLPDFPAETAALRAADWTVAPLPTDLLDRRVEITGPVERKMIINALNSGANCFMADFEDSNSPTWANCIDGQVNLIDAVAGSIEFDDPARGKHYQVGENPAVLLVRPRGLHLVEKHLLVDGQPAPASLVDFGLYFFHNAAALLTKGTGPYFYLPKLQHYREARWWNGVFVAAQQALGIAKGTIKATVLIETLPAAFQMNEILWELRDHSSGLNCGRWDYIFSFIKTLQAHREMLLPDRAQVGMSQPFMAAYTSLLIQTCHRRKVHAMGGMAAQIPIKRDPVKNAAALEKVRLDKLREVKAGHDGTWVAHPGLVAIARQVFDTHMPASNQLTRLRPEVSVSQAELLAVPAGTRTLQGVAWNARVGLQYLEAWLRGNGCVPLYDLMEDAATAEISRAQLWQQAHHKATLEDGSVVTEQRVVGVIEDQAARLGAEAGPGHRFADAARIFVELVSATRCPDFLTLPAYDLLD